MKIPSSRRKFRRLIFLVSNMTSGGAERVAATLANAWAMRGDDITIVATYSGQSCCFYPLDPRVNLVFLGSLPGCSKRSPTSYFRRLLALRSLVRQMEPDVVLSFLSNVNVSAILSCIGLKPRIVVSERTYPPKAKLHWAFRALRRFTYPAADAVVMQTEEGRAWLHKAIPSARSFVIPNPLSYPLDRGSNVPIDASRHMLLSVGRLVGLKQFNLLINVFARLTRIHPTWDLYIVGDGPERRSLDELIRSSGLESRVFMPGTISGLADWYARANLFALTSSYEGFPNALLEAMSYGCPAVSFDCMTGPREIIAHGINGLLVDPRGGEPAFSKALCSLMGDEHVRRSLGDCAREVQARFSLSNILKQWDAILGEP